jgi:hypothetical protein
VPGLLFTHTVEHCRGGWKILPQLLRVIPVNALIFLLQRNREGQYFTF